MARVNLVSNANITAVAIVDKGANRKRFFLTKAEGEGAEPLPAAGRLVKAADWSAVYCVVAEPGWHESPGIGAAEPDVDDVWASEEEIRKAAHRFMANGGLINKMHESLEPYGQLVESTVALADFEVNGETIRKGSWYIAIEPTPEGKEAIEKGEFAGVSIEGTAVRELVEKGSTTAKRTFGSMNDSLLKRIAKAVGLSEQEVAELEKANLTFGEIIVQREFEDALPEAFDAFRESVWRAFFPAPEESFDPVSHVTESCDEFKAWVLQMLDQVPVEKAERGKALGVDPDGSIDQIPTFKSEDEMLTPDEKARIEKLETDVAAIGEGVSKLVAKAEAEAEPEAPTVEDVTKQLGEVAASVKKLGEDVAKLGEGGSTQPEDPASTTVTKEEAEAVAKAFEKSGVSPTLAGVLG